jgi:hypothetical protein
MAYFCGPFYDLDAAVYFSNIDKAGSSISNNNKNAVNDFIKGCKADGIWNAIKACCLLAGPDTLAGALVPLVGPAPTNFNFVAGDYNRVTGLKGNGSNKYLNSNRLANADPLNNTHMALYQTELTGSANYAIGVSTSSPSFAKWGSHNTFPNSIRIGGRQIGTMGRLGFVGASNTVAAMTARSLGVNTTTSTSITQTAQPLNMFVFGRNLNDSLSSPTNPRISFYSFGESLDLALLDARLTTYMASIQ